MKKILFPFLFSVLIAFSALADGGMWLMQQMATKYAAMQSAGLQLEAYDIYNPQGTALKDGVLIFGNGCTGVVVSDQSLVLTNHHCGYEQIQQHSTVEHNYLQDGFWAMNQVDELPNPDLTVTFIDQITDVTQEVKAYLRKHKVSDPMVFLSPSFLSKIVPTIVDRKAQAEQGVEYLIKAFYGGNQYLMFKQIVYRDVRLVAAPPSTIGKYGEDTDNWVWPRHSGDFSIFRIYADKNGKPADYSPKNIPLKPKRHVKVSTQGVKEGDFAMIMGFPGTTYHFFTPAEVEEWGTIDNDIRIRMRDIRQKVMLNRMLEDPKTKIMYAAKYASSQNGYKRAIGANWAITKRGLMDIKRQQMQSLLDWGTQRQDKTYQEATERISRLVSERRDMRTRMKYLEETAIYGIECIHCPIPAGKTAQESAVQVAKDFTSFYNKDYSPALDAEIAKAMLREYCARIAYEYWPQDVQRIRTEFGGSVAAYIDNIFAKSVYRSHEAFEAVQTQGVQAFISWLEQKDPMVAFARSIRIAYQQLRQDLKRFDAPLAAAQQIYIQGMMQMLPADAIWPDANFTLRFTFGQMKGYFPRDNVYYGPQTTLAGVMEKEDPTNWEYNVSPRLKEIYETKDYGSYAMADGRMPVNLCATTHTTGGNSGSPVFNNRGELIGLNFDRNWEGVGGDIEYLPDYQRSIICDIRYLLMVVDKLGGCQRIIDEMLPDKRFRITSKLAQ